MVTYNKQLKQIQAIENFVFNELTVEKGNDKKFVVVVPMATVCAMTKIYVMLLKIREETKL
ncbi:hypothetical protein [Anaerotignum propionicum]|uniref:hypothetical protein n=1 Tax=Anaerotignum propionicum TaxID=28446 RepID=UPI002B20990B|nr:hypothetical protein [Anaerotignum propionicum]